MMQGPNASSTSVANNALPEVIQVSAIAQNVFASVNGGIQGNMQSPFSNCRDDLLTR